MSECDIAYLTYIYSYVAILADILQNFQKQTTLQMCPDSLKL